MCQIAEKRRFIIILHYNKAGICLSSSVLSLVVLSDSLLCVLYGWCQKLPLCFAYFLPSYSHSICIERLFMQALPFGFCVKTWHLCKNSSVFMWTTGCTLLNMWQKLHRVTSALLVPITQCLQSLPLLLTIGGPVSIPFKDPAYVFCFN